MRGGFLRPYREVFRVPGAWRFSVAGIVGRMPISMFGLGTVLLISAGTGRYDVAGSVSAAGSLGMAACAPQVARLSDARGQRAVLIPLVCLFALGVAGLITAVAVAAPDWTLFLCGIVAGASMPALGPMARARWSALLTDAPLQLHTAFSVESVADELCFVVGPAAVTVLATEVYPAAGVGAAGVLCLAGTLWFASQHATQPTINTPRGRYDRLRPDAHRGSGGPGDAPWEGTAGGRPPGLVPPERIMASPEASAPAVLAPESVRRPLLAAPGLLVLLPVYLFLGAMFVAIDLSTVAFAAASGLKPLAGVILGCYAAGSATGGLAYGARHWNSPVWRRFAVTLTVTVTGVCTFWAMPSLLVLGIVAYLCGLSIAPTLIAGYSLLEEQALPGRRTEAMTWLSTGIGVGVACGSTAAGFVVDALGPRWGYAFAGGCGVVAVLLCLAGLRRLRAEPGVPGLALAA
jgi:MFS family permease